MRAQGRTGTSKRGGGCRKICALDKLTLWEEVTSLDKLQHGSSKMVSTFVSIFVSTFVSTEPLHTQTDMATHHEVVHLEELPRVVEHQAGGAVGQEGEGGACIYTVDQRLL